MNKLSACILAPFVLFVCQLGCSSSTAPPTDDHSHADEHDHHLESLASGIEQLQIQLDQIKAAFEAGTPSECDEALHEAVHLLDQLPKAADVEAMASEDQEMIKANCKDLFDYLGKIHDGFHGGGEVDVDLYDSVKQDIENAMKNLSSKTTAAVE